MGRRCLHMHAATERSRRRFNIFAMLTSAMNRPQPSTRRRGASFGIIGALGFFVAGKHRAAADVAAHCRGARTTKDDEPATHSSSGLDDEVFVTGQQPLRLTYSGHEYAISPSRDRSSQLAAPRSKAAARERSCDGAELAVLENAELGQKSVS